MNIGVNSNLTTNTVSSTSSSKSQNADSPKFAEELQNLSGEKTKEEKTSETKETKKSDKEAEDKSKDDIGEVIDGLEDAVAEINDKLNQTDENEESDLKDGLISVDKNTKNEGNALINNDMNIQDPNEALKFQMNASMNFNSDGQPFSDLMKNQDNTKLKSSAKDLAEEQAVLSTMDENIAMANKNRVLAGAQEETQSSRVKTVTNSDGVKKVDKQSNVTVETVTNSDGVKKVDKQSNVTVETVVKYDSIIMNESDVDFFVKLVENGQADASAAAAKNSKVSKALADLIAKSMKDNQPVRIDFDNNISVIIKIGRDGKISADFLPSSQVAEAYLKENLPLLKQRFDESNIEYDELNHRQQKQDEKENQKKGRKDE